MTSLSPLPRLLSTLTTLTTSHFGLRLFVAATLLLGSMGCWVTKTQGLAMEEDIVALKLRLDDQKREMEALEARAERERQSFKQEQERALAQVNESIEALNRVARKTGADLGVELEQNVAEVARLRGRLEEIQARLQMGGDEADPVAPVRSLPELDRSLNEAFARLEALEERAKVGPLQRPSDKNEFYKLAKSTLDSGDVGTGRLLFTEFASQWPQDALAANAHYWIGESFYAERRYREAIAAFVVVSDKYPKSDKVPDSLLKIGFCFIELKQPARGKDFLEEVTKSFPKSPAAKIAKERMSKL